MDMVLCKYMDKDQPESNQPQPAPYEYKESKGQKILREGSEVISIFAMLTSFIAMFKSIFGKK